MCLAAPRPLRIPASHTTPRRTLPSMAAHDAGSVGNVPRLHRRRPEPDARAVWHGLPPRGTHQPCSVLRRAPVLRTTAATAATVGASAMFGAGGRSCPRAGPVCADRAAPTLMSRFASNTCGGTMTGCGRLLDLGDHAVACHARGCLRAGPQSWNMPGSAWHAKAIGPEGQVVPRQWFAHPAVLVICGVVWGGARCCDATLVFRGSRYGQPKRRSADADKAALATATSWGSEVATLSVFS